MIGPPWAEPASALAINGTVIELHTVSTPDLVRALLTSESSDASGLAVVALYCTDRSWIDLAQLILPADTPVSFAVLHRLADRLIEKQLGMTRWRATRLWEQAIGSWPEVEGELILSGIDLLALPPHSATNAVYALLRKWVQPEERRRWLNDLDREPLREIRRQIDEEVPDETPDQFAMMLEMDRRRRSGRARPDGETREDPGAEIVMP